MLHHFTGNDGHGFNGDTDGANPYAPLVQGPDGNFYGTTANGSASNTGPVGTVFKMDASGNITILHHFLLTGGDGNHPYGALIRATDGNYYGTTYQGGVHALGIIYKISAGGTLTNLHDFNYSEGDYPLAGLIQATDGNFYGTASGGGTYNRGTVFKMTPGGVTTAQYSFAGGSASGSTPVASLIQATDGNLYGTTKGGGTSGFGTEFKVTPAGVFTLLHSFTGTAGLDGAIPLAGLIQATDGNFYGTTADGGLYGYGTVFKMNAAGTVTLLYSFNFIDGDSPEASLIQATDGNFYGTIYSGGTYSYGTLFRITPSGTLTTLRSFSYQPAFQATSDGIRPVAPLIQATDGKFYGTTYGGGSKGPGVVFRLDVGLTVPTFTITMNKSTYSNGETVTATEFRVKNPGAATPVNLRVWVKVPGVGEVTLISVGSDGSFQLPANIDVNLGPLSLFTVSAEFPPKGVWEFNSRITNPTTGALISEDLNSITIQ